ncbi:MAG: hypothetical protein M1837_000149 [Sclerophora amabilis]|nr:MAG: hypothetical protein M1837_000149 [Sclerophora amabilis]
MPSAGTVQDQTNPKQSPPPAPSSLLLTRKAVQEAHELIKPFIHQTPVVTSSALSALASSSSFSSSTNTPASNTNGTSTTTPGKQRTGHSNNNATTTGHSSASPGPAATARAGPTGPKINLFFKCENYQKVGAFKYRGATHALARLSREELERGVVTHSSGNHAQALALAARTRNVPAHIVMPTISTPSKIAATQAYGANVIFSGSTSQEREAVVRTVMSDTGAVLIPPYDHEHIILGQGTMALELEAQVEELCQARPELDVHHGARRAPSPSSSPETSQRATAAAAIAGAGHLDAVIAPLGGGGMLSGIATALAPTSTLVFGAEPSFQGADDGRRSLLRQPPERIPTVSSLTIADGLRTPLSDLTFGVVSDADKVAGLHAVSERQIVEAMRLCVERLKLWIEPSAAVGLAVVLWDEEFRRGLLEREKAMREEWERERRKRKESGESLAPEEWAWEGWNIGVVLSGGNTTIEAVGKIFDSVKKEQEEEEEEEEEGGEERGDHNITRDMEETKEREEGVVGMNGERVAENVAG